MNRTGNKNLTPKVISILFALILWIYVMSEINPLITRDFANIPVQLMNLDELKQQGLVIVGDQEFRVKVRITGRRNEIYKVNMDQIRVRADMRGYRLGSNNVPVEILGPNNVEVDVNPQFIRVELEEIVRKQRNVDVLISGTPKENYALGNPDFKPTVVWIEGPESYVNAVDKVVAKLDVSKQSENLSLSLPLKAVNSKGVEVPNVEVKTSYIDVLLPIDLLKTVPVAPQIEANAAEGYKVMETVITPNRVVLRGQPNILKEINEIKTEPIKVNNINEDQRLQTKLIVPEGVTINGEGTATVEIVVEKVDEKVIKINQDEIQFKNKDTDLVIDKSELPETFEIKLVALKTILDKIEPKDIEVLVDLKGLTEGQYTIEPVINIPITIEQDIKKAQLVPKSINIKLIAE